MITQLELSGHQRATLQGALAGNNFTPLNLCEVEDYGFPGSFAKSYGINKRW